MLAILLLVFALKIQGIPDPQAEAVVPQMERPTTATEAIPEEYETAQEKKQSWNVVENEEDGDVMDFVDMFLDGGSLSSAETEEKVSSPLHSESGIRLTRDTLVTSTNPLDKHKSIELAGEQGKIGTKLAASKSATQIVELSNISLSLHEA